MKAMKFILVILMTLVSQTSLAFGDPGTFGGDGNTLPWPWGTECPFPWSNIEGMWEQTEPKSKEFGHYFFEFEVIDEWASGTHVFRVNQYNDEGLLVASGKAVAPKGHRIVRAILIPAAASEQDSPYVVIVRAYNEDRFACSDKVVTVMTMRRRGGPVSDDIHMVIEKSAWELE